MGDMEHAFQCFHLQLVPKLLKRQSLLPPPKPRHYTNSITVSVSDSCYYHWQTTRKALQFRYKSPSKFLNIRRRIIFVEKYEKYLFYLITIQEQTELTSIFLLTRFLVTSYGIDISCIASWGDGTQGTSGLTSNGSKWWHHPPRTFFHSFTRRHIETKTRFQNLWYSDAQQRTTLLAQEPDDNRQYRHWRNFSLKIKGCPLRPSHCLRFWFWSLLCWLIITASFPKGVTKAVQYGKSVKAHSIHMSQFQLLPYDRVRDYFADQLGIPVSVSSIFNFNKEAFGLLEVFDNLAREKLNGSFLVHADETGINVKGKRYGLHCAMIIGSHITNMIAPMRYAMLTIYWNWDWDWLFVNI